MNTALIEVESEKINWDVIIDGLESDDLSG